MILSEDDKDRVIMAFELDGYRGVIEVVRETRGVVIDPVELECVMSFPMRTCSADTKLFKALEQFP